MTRVVIDIPEKIMEHIKIQDVKLSEFDVICEAIDNGEIIPAGCGDLIDRNSLEDVFYGDYDGKTYFSNEVKRIIDNAPAIIEANKENKQ